MPHAPLATINELTVATMPVADRATVGRKLPSRHLRCKGFSKTSSNPIPALDPEKCCAVVRIMKNSY